MDYRITRATDKVGGVQFLVLEMSDGLFAVGWSKAGRVHVDGVQRWSDQADAYIEALDRLEERRKSRKATRRR